MNLLGLAEIAELFDVTKQVVANWRTRKPNFPPPVVNLKAGPVWSREAIVAWATEEGLAVQLSPEDMADGEGRSAKVAAMMNMKGGVGKSTLTANLGWYAAAAKDLRVLLIDLDPQFNLSQYILGVERYEQLLGDNSPTIDALFGKRDPTDPPVDLKDMIIERMNWQDGSCLHLVPAKLELAWNMKFAMDRPAILRDAIAEIRDEYDLIILDSSPTESILTWAIYYAADYIFVPVRPEFLSTIGLPLLIRSLEEFRVHNRNVPYPEIGGIIFNDTSEKVEHDRSRTFVKNVASENNLEVFENELSHSDSYPAGARAGKPILWTDNARDWKKSELRRVGREFLEKMELS
jgi:chromosome partitioning protein